MVASPASRVSERRSLLQALPRRRPGLLAALAVRSVNWDGGFAPCCYLTDKTQDFGDLNDSSVKKVWNNSKYTTARGLFKNDFIPEEWVGCLDCSVYLGSSAAKHRGPVDLYLEPVALQVNDNKTINGNRRTSGTEMPESAAIPGSQNGQNEQMAEAKTEEPV